MGVNLLVAFLTGLTAGGVGCLATQSGLLAGSLSRHFERHSPGEASRPRVGRTISLFLIAKLIAYTILGLLLGGFGSFLQLTPRVRAFLMIAVGGFIAGNGLRMLGVHPVFRWFVFEAPHAVTRLVRRTSKNGGASPVTPIILGTMTVLLPCGISQAMMAAALGSGDPLQGGALLFAFTLGTTPLFFSVAYCAGRLGAVLEARCTKVVATILLGLGLVSIVHGLNLAGLPVSFPYAAEGSASESVPRASVSTRGSENGVGRTIAVSDDEFKPKVLHLPADRQVTLVWATRDTSCCGRSVVVPGLDYMVFLPPTGRVPMTIAPQKPGTILFYSCATGRNTGRLIFDLE